MGGTTRDKPFRKKGGKSKLRDMPLEDLSTQHPSMAVIHGILSKSELSGALSTYPFAANNPDKMNATKGPNAPKSVREWVDQTNTEMSRTQTEANITSSLMKKKTENAQSNNHLKEIESLTFQEMMANQLYSQADLKRTPKNNMLLSNLEAEKSAELQQLFSSQKNSETHRSSALSKKMSLDQKLDYQNLMLQQRGMAKTPSASTFKEPISQNQSVEELIMSKPPAATPPPAFESNKIIDRGQPRELFLTDEQKQVRAQRNLKNVRERANQIVKEQGFNELGQIETDLALQKAKFEEQIHVRNETIRAKKNKLKD